MKKLLTMMALGLMTATANWQYSTRKHIFLLLLHRAVHL